MLNDDGAALEVGFAIDTGSSFDSLMRLQQVMDSTEAKVLAEANRIEQATSGMVNLAPATAAVRAFANTAATGMNAAVVGMTAFGNAATREGAKLAAAKANAEKAAERLISRLDRETAALGKSKEQMRDAAVEAAALAAAELGLTDSSDRLLASARARQAVARSLAEDRTAADLAAAAQAAREQAAAEAALNAQLLERSRLQAALDRTNGTDRARAVDAGATFGALAAKAEEEAAAAAVRERTDAERALNAQLLERSRLQAALDRTNGADRPRATSAGATFSALAAKAAEDEARATALAAAATKRAADEHARLAAAVRDSHAAQMADAAAAERLRAATDPLYAATSRLNAEIAESTRLYYAGATAPAEYARQQAVLTQRLREVQQAHDKVATTVRRGTGSLTQLSFQLNDAATMAASGSSAFQIMATQLGQTVQVFQLAEGGAKGLAKEIGLLALRFAPLLIAGTAAAAGLGLLVRWVNEGVTNDQLTSDLGRITGGANATAAELYRMRDATVTWGDVTKAVFSEIGKDVAKEFVGDMKGMSGQVKGVLDDLTSQARHDLALIYSGLVGFKSYMGELEKGGIGGFAKIVTGGDPTLLDRTFGEAYRTADKYLTDLGKRVKRAAVDNARHRLAESIGFNNGEKPRVDRHAEQLEREARAVEAQIRNLYALADAYGVSGAAALIAEARVKAESEAIKKRGDIEAAVDRQIRLAIAQRVSDAAKSTATLVQQATAQEEMNAAVKAGLVPAEQAGDMLRDRLEDMPLLAAIEAAKTVNDVKGAQKAAEALEKQRASRDRLTDAERRGQLLAATVGSNADRLAELREELRLVGATDEARARALATLRATQETTARGWAGPEAALYVQQQVEIAVGQVRLTAAQEAYNAELSATADWFELIDGLAQDAASGIADAFGQAGAAIGDVLTAMTGYYARQARLEEQHRARVKKIGGDQRQLDRENQRFALQSSAAQISSYGDMAAAAKGFFKEGSAGYKALQAAETVYRVAQLAMSLSAMAQGSAETAAHVANAGARATADGAAGVAAQSKLPFPANIAAMAATAAALVAAGVAVFGGGGGRGNTPPVTNTGTGTVLGDAKAQSESLRRAIDQLREVDQLTSTFARQMAGSLRSIDSQIGSLAAVLVRSGNINADAGVAEGFKPNFIGSVLGSIPLVGGFLSGLFGSSTKVQGNGLYGGRQTIEQILARGFDASTYTDIQKKSRFLGIKTGQSNRTRYGEVDPDVEKQFTLLLTSFATSIANAAGPLGEATEDVQARLNRFVVNIGKIDLKDLTGTEIQEKLEAVFGAAADGMAMAAFPGIEKFQQVGEGVFETLVRVASTAEAVTNALSQMGGAARAMSIDAKLGLAEQFDSIGDLTSAIGAYFEAFYSPAEQLAAKTAQVARVFTDLQLTMPTTLAGYRALVDAQNLNTAAGRETYATLIKLAPAFAELQEALAGAKSAADIAAERADLRRRILELNGDTAALRALELAELDASNRDLQKQIYAIEDAKEAAAAAEELREAWKSVGDSIMDEVERIRGVAATEAGGFAAVLGRFNAANAAARGGDLEAAKTLPQLSQAVLAAAADAATSRQELDRIRAQTAAALEATYAAIGGSTSPTSAAALLAGASTAQTVASAPAANDDDAASELRALRFELAGMRADNNAGHAAVAGNTGRVARTLDAVTAASGGDAITTVVEAAA